VAHSLLRVAGALPEGATVAVLGAAGGVGSAVPAARPAARAARGGRGRRRRQVRLAAGPGQQPPSSHRSEPIAQGVLRATGGAGAQPIFDPVGGRTLPTLFEALAPLGTVLSYGGLGGPRDAQTVAAMMRRFGASPALRLFSMHTWDAMPEVRREIAQAVMALLAQGRIEPPIHARLPLAQARQAHELFEAHEQRGEIILEP
jgi:NADPH2:quinone reductase